MMYTENEGDLNRLSYTPKDLYHLQEEMIFFDNFWVLLKIMTMDSQILTTIDLTTILTNISISILTNEKAESLDELQALPSMQKNLAISQINCQEYNRLLNYLNLLRYLTNITVTSTKNNITLINILVVIQNVLKPKLSDQNSFFLSNVFYSGVLYTKSGNTTIYQYFFLFTAAKHRSSATYNHKTDQL